MWIQISVTGFQSLSGEPGFWISIVSGIPDSLSCISDSKVENKEQTSNPAAKLQLCTWWIRPFQYRVALRSFLDKSGKRKRLCRHLLNRLISQSSSFLDESDKSLYWINQFYLCTRAYSGVLPTVSAPTLHNNFQFHAAGILIKL